MLDNGKNKCMDCGHRFYEDEADEIQQDWRMDEVDEEGKDENDDEEEEEDGGLFL